MTNEEIVKIATKAGFSAYYRDGNLSIAVIDGCGGVVCTEEFLNLLKILRKLENS